MDSLAVVVIVVLFIMLIVSRLRIRYLERKLEGFPNEMFRGGTIHRRGVEWMRDIGCYTLHHLNTWQSGESTRMKTGNRYRMRRDETMRIYNAGMHLITVAGSAELWLDKLEGMSLQSSIEGELTYSHYIVVNGAMVPIGS